MQALAFYPTALFVNLTAVLCIAPLIGLGVYVNKVQLLAQGIATNGFAVIHVNQKTWNIGCTVLGTAVGLLLASAFSSHDDLLTRKDILNPRGVLAMYIQPLSARRGLQELRRG
jgi:hypothetical protein